MEPRNTIEFQKPPFLIFDVYETLLDLTYIQRKVNNLLNSKRAYTLWFELLMQYCFVDNSIGTFHPFASISRDTLQLAARKLGETISKSDAEGIVQLFDQMPVNEGVPECISALSNHDFKIAALTNASKEIIENRMGSTGLISYFEMVISADEIKKYKPATEVYQLALKKLGIAADEALYISTHAWDIAGATSAGLKTAYLKNGQDYFSPLGIQPTVQFQNFEEFVRHLTQTSFQYTEV